MALIIRKTEDGTRLEGGAPDEHTFSARQIERELADGLLEVRVTLNTTDGPHVYRLQGFEQVENEETGETTSNLSAWICTKEA